MDGDGYRGKDTRPHTCVYLEHLQSLQLQLNLSLLCVYKIYYFVTDTNHFSELLP